ncbi:hypothetical protein MSIBF_A1360022 [groundwater metagenome]|uniref:Transposase n=1 Tax=groundwater metagenome TaxID=717931 RepID=A0A098E636_9ZZZZ
MLKRYGKKYLKDIRKIQVFYTDDWDAYKGVIPEKNMLNKM